MPTEYHEIKSRIIIVVTCGKLFNYHRNGTPKSINLTTIIATISRQKQSRQINYSNSSIMFGNNS